MPTGKATKKEKQAFQSDVASAVKIFEKSISEAQKTVTMAGKKGSAKQQAQAKDLLKQLTDLQPIIDKLKQAKSPTATYGGPITQPLADQLNRDIQSQAMGAVARGEYGAANNQRFVYAREADIAGFEGLSSDSYFTSTGGTGTSNTGKYYYKGKVVPNREEWVNLITQEAVDGDIGGAITGEPGAGDVGLYGGGSFYGSSGISGAMGGGAGGTGISSMGLGGAAGGDTWWSILRSKLLIAGIPQATVDKSKNYFQTLITDLGGMDNASIDTAVDYFFYSKDYKSLSGQTLESPYYTDFGFYNEKLDRPLLPRDLVPTVIGYQDIGKQYSISNEYTTKASIQKYLVNRVSVSEFADRVNTASLKAVTADPNYVKSLKTLGYITNDNQLTDFFLNPDIGTTEMKNRQRSAAFVAEAVRRSTPEMQLVDTEFAKQQAARYAEQGYTEAQISTLAATGYQNIAEQLPETIKLSQIYETPRGTTASTTLGASIQSELQQEEFMNVASSRKRKLYGMEAAKYSGRSGVGILGSKSLGAF